MATVITADILISFATMRNRQSQVTTPNDIVLALMTSVERVQQPTTGRLSVRPGMKYYLKYRCPMPVCAVGLDLFLDEAGYNSVAPEVLLHHRMSKAG